jgi:hypothetical protein
MISVCVYSGDRVFVMRVGEIILGVGGMEFPG